MAGGTQDGAGAETGNGFRIEEARCRGAGKRAAAVAGRPSENPPSLIEESAAPTGDEINFALREHQDRAAWAFQGAAGGVSRWVQTFNVEFKLHTPVAAVCIQILPGCLARFRPGRNGFALAGELTIDSRHIEDDPPWMICGTILHVTLHAWQAANGVVSRRNYHDAEFRAKAAFLGLKTDRDGNTEYLPGETPFAALLSSRGVVVPDVRAPQPHRISRTGSKMRLYVCPSCGVKVRHGTDDLDISCNHCHRDFKRVVAGGGNPTDRLTS